MGQHAVNYSRDTINRQFLSGEHKLVNARLEVVTGKQLSLVDLTADGNYRTYDITQKGVPSDAVAVLLHVRVEDNAPEHGMLVRTPSSSSGYDTSGILTQVANIITYGTLIALMENGNIEYAITAGTNTVEVGILGWFI